MKAAFSGPWRISKKVSDVNYLVETPTRRKQHQLCHINMLKKYENREVARPVVCVNKIEKESPDLMDWEGDWPKTNSAALENLDDM